MHVTFDPDKVDWANFLTDSTQNENQFGSGYQGGRGHYFVGMPYQRGTGIGSVFRTLFRHLLPYGKKIGAAIGQEGLVTTNRILNNVLEGQNFQDALKNEARVGVGNLLSKASDHLQKGHGKKRRGRPKAIKEDKKSKKLLLTSRVGPLPKRSRLRVDTLGYY